MTEDSYIITVIFHNLKAYGSHLILQNVTREYAPNSIDVIPTSSEKLLCFQIGNLRFLDSLQFLTDSLDTLVQSLAADDSEKFSHTARHYPDSDLVFAKGNYPYEYMEGRHKFFLTELPPIDAFYSSLSEETINQEEYERAQEVWREFKIKNMQQYHDHYLNLDVLLLLSKIVYRRVSWTTNSTPHIIILYQDSHSMRVSNLQNRNWTCLRTVKSSFSSRTLFAAALAS